MKRRSLVDLWDAVLTRADLRCADLAGAYLPDAYLLGANLEGANLEGANLEHAILAGAAPALSEKVVHVRKPAAVADVQRVSSRRQSVTEQQDDRCQMGGRAGAVDGKREDSCAAVPADGKRGERERERPDEHAEAVHADQQHVEDRLLERDRIEDAEGRDHAEPDPVLAELRGSERTGEVARGGSRAHAVTVSGPARRCECPADSIVISAAAERFDIRQRAISTRAMAGGRDRRRDLAQLREDVEVLHKRLAEELDRGDDRDVVLAIARELRERQDRLSELEGFPPSSQE